MLRITDTLVIDDDELAERFIRASGPGGQNVNKVSTAVQLRFDVSASSLPSDVKTRLMGLAGKRLTGGHVVVIESREHRTQAMNRTSARARLIALIRQAAVRPKKRTATKPAARSREKRLEDKKRRGAIKGSRGRIPAD